MEQKNNKLKRGLKPRHVEMIAIGGTIGTGLFLGTGFTISQAGGGGTLLAYVLAGIVVYLLINCLGEMAVYMPVSGSFQTYSDLFVHPALGFAYGWNYWFSWAFCLGMEVVAASVIMQGFFPAVPPVIWCIALGLGVMILNLLSVKAYGEAEFWFAGIKVVTIIAFLIVGALLITGAIGNQGAIGFSNWSAEKGGLFPNGLAVVATIAFSAINSYGGTETIGIAAGETQDPAKNIPRAVRTVFVRILLFYVGTITVISLIVPYMEASVAKNPFAMVFSMAGMDIAATVMNVVILTAVMSAANSSIYICSRTMMVLASEGKAPKMFAKVNSRGVPARAIALTMVVGALALFTSVFAAEQVFVCIFSTVSLAILFSWSGIAISHYNFRKWLVKHGGAVEKLRFKARFYPYGSMIILLTVVVAIIGQFFNDNGRLSAMLGVPFFFLLVAIGKYRHNKGLLIRPAVDIEECNANIGCAKTPQTEALENGKH